MDYTQLSLAEVRTALEAIAAETQATFGTLEARELNWKPDRSRWSVAQCFQHLLGANQLMLDAATRALHRPAATIWQRLPMLPRFFGRALIRSQGPVVTRRYIAPAQAQPAESDLPSDVIARFVAQQHELATWMATLDERAAAKAIMVSPFIRVVTYSVLDGCRLMAAHDRRHFEQARRVLDARATA